jgi:hypothetical protein
MKKERSLRAIIVFFVGALILCAHPAAAQHSHACATNQPVELHPGLGNYEHPITTTSTDGQTHFNQGLILLYGFNHDEAARHFRRAAELDPEAAMAYWGLPLALGHPGVGGPSRGCFAIASGRA